MARLQVKVRPNARQNAILAETPVLTVAIAAPAEGGKANRELIRFLSHHFKRQVRIISGFGSAKKTLEILE